MDGSGMLPSTHTNHLLLPRCSSSPSRQECPPGTSPDLFPVGSVSSPAAPLWHARGSTSLPEQPRAVAPFAKRNRPEHSRLLPRGLKEESCVWTWAASPSPNATFTCPPN